MKAGWYPSPVVPERQDWWDGHRWHDPARVPPRNQAILITFGVIALALIIGALAASSGSSNAPSTPHGVTPATIQVGDPAVYAAIKATTNCEDLQERFNQAMEQVEAREPLTPERNVFEAYADATYLQAQRSGCYG